MSAFKSFLSSILAVVLLTAVCLSPCGAAAEDLSGRWGAGLEGGVMKLTEGYWDYSNVDQFSGLHVSRGLSRTWNLEVAFKYGYVRPGALNKTDNVGWDFGSGAPLYTVIYQPTAKLQYRFIPDSKITPWVGAGLGLTSWKVLDKKGENVGWFPTGDATTGYDKNGNEVTLKGNDFTISLELGIDFFLTENLAFNLGGRYHLMPGNEKDNIGMSTIWGPEYVDANTALAEGFLGLTWWFGSTDRDKDGIPNKFDSCPEQPEDPDGFDDTDGCPDPDNDGDGILDAADGCPEEAEDVDGFADEDGCPDPDNDGDGIVDADDACPDEAEDVDGFQDDDGCPDPDNDGDGVLDAADQCPDTPAGVQVDEHGCPVVAEIKAELVLEGVSFMSGSAQLTPESIGVLARLAESLRAWPNEKIEIRGHTDSTGGSETNRDLSHRRAMSVRDSLIHMGIDPGRVSAVGYGEDFPIADNSTREGRAQNRRVEIHRVDQ